MKKWTHKECEPFYTGFRPAKVMYWYDGDTPMIRINLGFTINGIESYVRVLSEKALTTPDDKSDDGIDIWELRGIEREEGKIAKARAQELIPDGSDIRIWSYKASGDKGRYGRWLCIILFKVEEDCWMSIGDVLVEEGHGTYEDYT